MDKEIKIIKRWIAFFHDHFIFKRSDHTITYSARAFFERRKKKFLEEQKSYTWLSWDVAEEYVKERLTASQISLIK